MGDPQSPIKWVSGTLLFRQPKGHNDVYWCHASNGPATVRDTNVCQRCGQQLADDPNPHSFVAHIEMEK
jgi:hypothetical protein